MNLGWGPGIGSFNKYLGWFLSSEKPGKHCFIVYSTFLFSLPPQSHRPAKYLHVVFVKKLHTSVWQREHNMAILSPCDFLKWSFTRSVFLTRLIHCSLLYELRVVKQLWCLRFCFWFFNRKFSSSEKPAKAAVQSSDWCSFQLKIGGKGENGKLFHCYRGSVFQDENSSGDWLYNNANILNTTEMYA